ncbi:reverse transcriptase [Corchorus capsularis]|uniref:Reverse transcriptase n=1 Tax=Corchorus capsularis TaxID=210143 RepID=A0A1R3HRY4_COCAP|nr:reverse transcriptase [Corchorus capsularis]
MERVAELQATASYEGTQNFSKDEIESRILTEGTQNGTSSDSGGGGANGGNHFVNTSISSAQSRCDMVLLDEDLAVREVIDDHLLQDLDVLELSTDDEVNQKVKQHSLVGKAISDKVIKLGPLRAILSKAWPLHDTLEIHELECNVFLFVFKDENDKRRVIQQGPWSVMNKHLMLKEWPVEAVLEEIDFTTSEFWVQAHNLLMSYLTKSNAEKIASMFPELVELDFDPHETFRWNDVLRMKVKVNIEDPLKTGFNLKRRDKPYIWVSFKYERLPDLCFTCGRIGHVAKDCIYRLDDQPKENYGHWMKATQAKQKQFSSGIGMSSSKLHRQTEVPRKAREPHGHLESHKPLSKEHVQSLSKSDKELIAANSIVGTIEPVEKEPQAGTSHHTCCCDNIQQMELDSGSIKDTCTWATNEFEMSKEPVSFLGKRSRPAKMDIDLVVVEALSKKRKNELISQISNWVYEHQPGMWDISQIGQASDNQLLCDLFGHKKDGLESNLIGSWETSCKGRSSGNRCVLRIKKAARMKALMEARRICAERSEIYPQGQDSTKWMIHKTQTIELAEALATVEWSDMFANAQGLYEVSTASDHCPVILCLDKLKNDKRRDFRFETKWLLDEECSGIVEEGWQEPVSGLRMFKLARKMAATRENLRRRRNSITRIKGGDDNWITDEADIRSYITEYYKELFTAGDLSCIDEVLDAIDEVVTPEMNEGLNALVEVAEIEKAAFSLGAHKAPGPDGFLGIFFHQFWEQVKPQVVQAVQSFFESGHLLRDLNRTNIILIPKQQCPETLAHHRPIGLCNFIYKIISKILANRVKNILPEIISPTQSAFIHGRQIQDNIIVAHQAFHALKGRSRGHNGYMALKLDLSKAYDRVEWPFLEKLLHNFLDQSVNAGELSNQASESRIWQMIANIWGFQTIWGRGKRAALRFIFDKIQSKVQGWKGKLLSHAGREVLLKSVAAAVPVYVMRCFLLPLSFCKDIDGILNRFWWTGSDENENRVHWLKWAHLAEHKDQGGMGFRDFHSFNLALLAKQIWRLLKRPESLCFKVLKSVYFPHSSLLEANKGKRGSWAWKSLYEGIEVLRKGTRWNISNGEEVLIWHDKWIPNLPFFRVTSQPPNKNRLHLVRDLIDPARRKWKEDVISQLFNRDEAKSIVQIPIGPPNIHDKLVWHFTNDGEYTVKSGYRFIHGKKQQLRRETSTSTSQQSSLATWRVSTFSYTPTREGFGSFRNWWEEVYSHLERANLTISISLMSYLCWNLWKARNALIFEGQIGDPKQVWINVQHEFNEFTSATVTTNSAGAHMRQRTTWQPPPVEFIKINCDAAFDLNSGKAGIAAVCRDHSGAIVQGASGLIHVGSIDAAEAYAVRLACSLVSPVMDGRR